MLSKCLHRPSMGAWRSALHLLHFLYANRETGIRFNDRGNLEPVCYYDSGFYRFTCQKPQCCRSRGNATALFGTRCLTAT